MSDETPPPPFDLERAEYAGAAAAAGVCARCENVLRDEYHLAGAALICVPCEREVSGGADGLPTALRLFRACGYGLAVTGVAIGLLIATQRFGFQILLMAVSGMGIGIAVRIGSGGRGGWPFQIAAALCAYLAATLSFVPLALQSGRLSGGLGRAVLVCLGLPFTAGDQRLMLWLMAGVGAYVAIRMNGRRPLRLPGPFRLRAASAGSAAAEPCPSCGADQPPGMTACPSCARLVHGARLRDLIAEGRRAEAAGDATRAVTLWREILELLPPGSRQQAAALGEVRRLSGLVEEAPAAAAGGRFKRGWLGLGALAVFLLTKGKFLLAGLTKLPTLLSMLATVGVYMSLFGWKFAVGFIVSLYIHEMGHVWMLRRYGIRASAPMFIPGLGAFVRLQQYPATVREDARVGLAGPIWGLGAAAAATAVWAWSGAPVWGAIAKFGAWLNLFNLLPVWQFDGGRGFRSLPRWQRWIAAAVLAGAWHATGGETLLFILLLCAAGRALFGDAPRERDDGILIQYVLLVGLLTWIFLRIPLPPEAMLQDPVPQGDGR